MKPIQIEAVAGGYVVRVNGEVARAYGAKKRKQPLHGNVVHRDGSLAIVTGLEPMVCDAERASSIAHQIGRYLMGFGDLVFAYTDAPAGFFGA